VHYVLVAYGEASLWDAVGLGGTRVALWPDEDVAALGRALREFRDGLRETGELVTALGLADPGNTEIVAERDGIPQVTGREYLQEEQVVAAVVVVDVDGYERALAIAARLAAISGRLIELRPALPESR
jgi:hypothetical protein